MSPKFIFSGISKFLLGQYTIDTPLNASIQFMTCVLFAFVQNSLKYVIGIAAGPAKLKSNELNYITDEISLICCKDFTPQIRYKFASELCTLI